MARLFPSAPTRHFAITISQLVYINPFLPERIALERQALGPDFSDPGPIWSSLPGDFHERPNVARLQDRAESLAISLRPRLSRMHHVDPDDARLYTDLVLYVLYYRSWQYFDDLLSSLEKNRRVHTFKNFSEDFRHFLAPPLPLPAAAPVTPTFLSASPAAAHLSEPHVFALFFQIRRAFQNIFRHIIGSSMPVAQLRAAVWQSIFTSDLAAYRAILYDRLDDLPTLITGESGTGKELVARAIALSRYIPFDPKSETFALPSAKLFLPLNLSALSPTLIESELFGHRRGAFTGALENRIGWLEHCPPRGSVFLDEIGELDGQIQVKLLRVLHSRTFNRLGETDPRPFAGKIIAATNRNLPYEMHAGTFRRDLYYRLCADLITTPTLAEQLKGSPDPAAELRLLVQFIAHRIAGPDLAEPLTTRVTDYILQHLPDHPWPGNFRELEQCLRNILIRNQYHPATLLSTASPTFLSPPPAASPTFLSASPTASPPFPSPSPTHTTLPPSFHSLLLAMHQGTLSADQMLDHYIHIIHATTHSYEATARKLNLDRRTIRARLHRERSTS